jgi:hypothetical protein
MRETPHPLVLICPLIPVLPISTMMHVLQKLRSKEIKEMRNVEGLLTIFQQQNPIPTYIPGMFSTLLTTPSNIFPRSRWNIFQIPTTILPTIVLLTTILPITVLPTTVRVPSKAVLPTTRRFRNFGLMAVLYTVESRCKHIFPKSWIMSHEAFRMHFIKGKLQFSP